MVSCSPAATQSIGQLGTAAGYEFDFSVLLSDTMDSHRLVLWAEQLFPGAYPRTSCSCTLPPLPLLLPLSPRASLPFSLSRSLGRRTCEDCPCDSVRCVTHVLFVWMHARVYAGTASKGEELAHALGLRYFEQRTQLSDRSVLYSNITHCKSKSRSATSRFEMCFAPNQNTPRIQHK